MSEGRSTTRPARTVYGGKIRPGVPPGIVTRTLIALNVAAFIATSISGANPVSTSVGSSKLYDRFALQPVAVAHGQWYRLITSTFLHFGLLHIATNMFALWIVGPQLEAVLGRLRFVVLYALAGIGGGILTVALGPLNEQAAGASGAIFGLFAALYVVVRHLNLQTGGIAATIVLNLVISFSFSSYIDWRGHVGGLIVGGVIAAIYAYAPRGPSRARFQAAGVAGVAVVLAVGGLLAAHHTYNRCPDATIHNGVPTGFCFPTNPTF